MPPLPELDDAEPIQAPAITDTDAGGGVLGEVDCAELPPPQANNDIKRAKTSEYDFIWGYSFWGSKEKAKARERGYEARLVPE